MASTTALLEANGYVVSSAATGHDGLLRAQIDRPDLIVLDVMMENKSAGYELNEELKFGSEFESLRHVPILMVSSIPTDPATLFSRAEEVAMITPNVYMTKPLDIPRFLTEVASLLGERTDVPAGAKG